MKSEIKVFKDGDLYGVRLIIGVQSFQVGPLLDEEEEARWYADRLKGALKNVGVEIVIKKKIGTRF